MREDLQREEQLFSAALDIDDHVMRRAFVCRATEDDTDLQERILRLLATVDRTGKLFDRVDCSVNDDQLACDQGEKIGDIIGPYKLLEQIGEGGFGSVYVAEQNEPVKRLVALKIIKLGMNTRQVTARFEAERQALALMDHPNIAQVYDAGTTYTGRAYFVMELVRGVSLTKFCDSNRFNPEQRLRLFMDVCDAIQHAHQKGIIHRDLKPSNILVTMNGTRAIPKVIDFGIAKALREPLTDKTLYTRFHQFIGTPEYVSPEQAEMSEVAIDTRSDIYSLGIILYELLVGRPPFTSQELLKSGLHQLSEVLKQVVPTSPSRHLERIERAKLASLAKDRNCEPQDLRTVLRGDLDRILLKAIETNVEQRYASANSFAEDLQRFLNREPITAVAPLKVYLIKKFVSRHRIGVAMSAVVIISLITGLTLSLIGFARAQQANLRAEREASYANATLNFIQEDLLNGMDPYIEHSDLEVWGRNLTLLEAINMASASLENRFANLPEVEALLRLTIGRTYLRLGEVKIAGPHLERSVALFSRNAEDNKHRLLEARYQYAEFLLSSKRYDEAIALHEMILEARVSSFEFEDVSVLESKSALAWALFSSRAYNHERATHLFQEVIRYEGSLLNAANPVLISAKKGLAEIYFQTGRFDAYEILEDQVYQARLRSLGPNHPLLIQSEALKAYYLHYRDHDYHAADALVNILLEKCRRVLGPDHETTLFMVAVEGYLLRDKGLGGLAIDSRKQMLEVTRKRYGAEHITALWAEDMLGGMLRNIGNYEEAERIHRASVEVRSKTGYYRQSEHLRSWYYLSWALFHQGKTEEALKLYREVLKKTEELQGGKTGRTLWTAQVVSRLLGQMGDWHGLVQLYRNYVPHDSVDTNKRYSMGQLPITAGILAAYLANENLALEEWMERLMDRHSNEDNPLAVEMMANHLLALPPHLFDPVHWNVVLELFDRFEDKISNPMDKVLIQGMKSYRKHAYNETAKVMQPLVTNPDYAVASTSGFVRAMALFRAGSKDLAQGELAQASRMLEMGVKSGQLNYGGQIAWRYNLRWSDYARSLALRNEAERLVLGEIVSTPVDRQTLKLRRSSWQPVQSLLEEGYQYGRKRNWKEAAVAFAEAMEYSPINWEYEGNLIPDLLEKAAVVFALAGDFRSYKTLCESLIIPTEESQFNFRRIGLIWPNSNKPVISPEILGKAIESARWKNEQIKDDGDKQPPPWHERIWLFHGIAEYRAARYEDALRSLEKTNKAFHLATVGVSLAFSSLAATALERHVDAVDFLQKAKSKHVELLSENSGSLPLNWNQIALLELGITEAQAAIENLSVKRSNETL